MDNSSNEKQKSNDFERLDLELLVIGKKIGLSFDEMNLLRVRDLIEFINVYTDKKKEKPRKATQADINRFYN